MRKFKTWLFNTFLPAYAKDTLLREAEKLATENAELRHQIAERDAYIEGLERGLRSQRRIIINTTGGKQ